jgi:hypothetical protein
MYAPPAAPALYRQNVYVSPGATVGPVPSPMLRTLKLVAGIGQVVMLCGLIGGVIVVVTGGQEAAEVGGPIIGICAVLWYAFLLAYSISSIVWVYKFWSWIPPQERYTKLWQKYISPGTAAGFMFIPYFNIYWMFVVYLGIGDVFDRLRVAYPAQQESPKKLALAMLIVSLVFFPAAPFMHWLFAKRCEALATEINAKLEMAPGAVPGHAPPGYPAAYPG